ncbi:deoxyribodipyrimidine photo-lyase [Achromobacter ruhlandii]|uniref:deoxyribodipyrimidine photo-lyase n=1 Tax=Achromobacter ruhlandii TaxID=72557 RepID=UPI0022B890B2|nr:deoxyribodipyrimidine photo-lyase [Achromobacter ruhlandii]MCZ8399089.1 deoxyribodipyrimidine photo-lyase [Achromobacter ruhlandii]
MHTLIWLRTDLRLHDNPALAAAAADGTVTALFIAAPGHNGGCMAMRPPRWTSGCATCTHCRATWASSAFR